MTSALLILDAQNDFFGAENPNLAAFQATLPVINAASAYFHQQKWPVVFIQHTCKSKPAGSVAWQIYPQFNLKADDLRLSKAYYNAFWNTRLDSILKSLQITFVLVCGYVAEFCVLSTLRGATERGYSAAILAGAIASLEDRYTQVALDISPVITLAEVQKGRLI